MYFRRKRILIVSLVVTLLVVSILAVGIYFIIREFLPGDDDPEICIKARCMPSAGIFRRSASSYVCSLDECVVSSSNISDYSDVSCVSTECITRGGGKHKWYRKDNASTVCFDSPCWAQTVVPHLKPGGNCSTSDCIVSAGEILKSMDQSVKACDDFYRFSCHGAKHKIPDGQKTFSVDKALNDTLSVSGTQDDSDSLQKIRAVYRKCVDEGYSEIKDFTLISELLKKHHIGDWPLLESRSVNKNCRNEFELRTAMLHVYGVETFFRLDVDFSEEDSTSFIKMTIAPPLFDNICSEGDEETPKNKVYTAMMVKIFTQLLKDGGRARRAVEGIKDLDRQFCLATVAVANRTVEEGPSRITLEQLAEKSPQFNWKLWHSIISTEFGIDGRLQNAPFYAYDVHPYAENIFEMVNKTTAWINYLSAKFVLSYTGFLNRPLREIMMQNMWAFKDHMYYSMQPMAMVPRWKQCQKYLQKVMGIALIPPFVSQMLTGGVEREMEYLAELVKHSFKETFHRSRVLYAQEKKQIMKTITKFGAFLLYPDENETFYDEYFSSIGAFGDTFLETGMQVRLFHQRKTFEAVYRGAHDYDLELRVLLHNPFESNAFAAITENKTVVFIGGMHVAGVKPDVPRYMNFATLGTTIALEYVIGSHLLSERPGKDTFDAKEKKWRSWPEYIREHVSDKRVCYANKYSEEEQENGDYVVKEMMANVQALKESLQAYRIYCEKYGHEPLLPIPNLNEKGGDEQLFFILYVQSLCGVPSHHPKENEYLLPSGERVNEVLKNLEDFADAFHCPDDSPMNPSDKCGTIW